MNECEYMRYTQVIFNIQCFLNVEFLGKSRVASNNG